MSGLGEFDDGDDNNTTEHPAISDTLGKVFESGWPEELVYEQVEEQVESQGSWLEEGFRLPNTPYTWRETDSTTRKWEVMMVEYILCEESNPERRFRQAASRATEHLKCGSGETVVSALTRETFFEPAKPYDDDLDKTIEISAPSAELIRDILDEVERRIRSRRDVTIEEILEHHGN
jgi:hypothetical protein